MKKLLKNADRNTKIMLIVGWTIIAVMLAVSTVFYIGAGKLFDYYSAVAISEKLLTAVRPVSVGVFAVSTGVEYYSKVKKSSSE